MRQLLTVSAVLGLTFATPTLAAPKSNPATVDRDFDKLSKDGQRAFADIYQAQQDLSANQITQALPLIQDAQIRLEKAAKDDHAFMKAEGELPPAPGAPPKSVTHVPSTTPTSWIPVLGVYVVTDALAPEKQAALNSANKHLQQGQKQLAAQDLQLVGVDVDFIIGLAPMLQSTADVYRASVFLDGGDAKDANEALQDALDAVVFISQDTMATVAPTAPTKGKMAHHKAA